MSNVVSIPTTVNVTPENIPAELKSKDRWVVWGWEQRSDGKSGAKWTKPPFRADGQGRAAVNDPSSWSTFQDAIAALHKGNRFHGVGFVFTPEDDLIAWDLDHCLDPKTLRLKPFAEEIIDALQSYTEITPSGTGLRIIVRGKLPGDGRKKRGEVECYQELRYVTLTGNQWPGMPTQIGPHNEVIWEKYLGRQKAPEGKASGVKGQDHWDKLLLGEWKGEYPSQSEADLAYTRYLAEKTEGDPEQMDALFRQSGLIRPKWDVVHHGNGETYGARTIRLALEGFRRRFSMTDTGNAKRLAKILGTEARFAEGRWLVWDNRRFTDDRLSKIYLAADKVVQQIIADASQCTDEDEQKAMWGHAKKMESRAATENMLALARSREPLACLATDLDKDPELFNANNGTVDARTGEVREFNAADLMTKCSPVNAIPNTAAPVWAQFLEAVLPDEEVRSFVQRCIGYSMTGHVSEQKLFFVYGLGANGKTTFMNAIKDVFGDYAGLIPGDMIMASRNEQHPTGLADLRGIRLAIAPEVEDGKRFNEALIKTITGEGTIKARRMHQDFFEFESTAKLWIIGNHKPAVRGVDFAIWRRILLVPFETTIPESKQDRQLPTKLKEEREGILAWCLEGMMAWRREGLKPPPSVIAATEVYRSEMDVLQTFIDENCIMQHSLKVRLGELHERYVEVMDQQKEYALSSRVLGQKLREKGYRTDKGAGNITYVLGLKLKARQATKEEM